MDRPGGAFPGIIAFAVWLQMPSGAALSAARVGAGVLPVPTKPPSLRPRKVGAARKLSNWTTTRKSRQARGYGRAHERMRDQVLREEPLCRICASENRVAATEIADHIKPKAEGGTDDRDNYQGLCRPCHAAKTTRESARARRRAQA